MLKCTRCKQIKEDNEFYPSKHTRCIKCVSEMNAEGYLKRKNKDKHIIEKSVKTQIVPTIKTEERKMTIVKQQIKMNPAKQKVVQDGYYFKWV